MDLSSMTEEELEALRNRVSEEQVSRMCPTFLAGHRSCDQGRTPHDEHGYTMWDQGGTKVRVTWRPVVERCSVCGGPSVVHSTPTGRCA